MNNQTPFGFIPIGFIPLNMAIKYITTLCRVCEAELSLEIGSPAFCSTTHIECKLCGTLNATNNKPYSQLSLFDKVYRIIRKFVFDTLFIVPLGIILLSFSSTREPNVFIGIVGIVFIAYNGYKVLTLIDMIPKIEEEQKRIDEILRKLRS